ncbi:GntR family transcriptional regulator [Amycolatopsis sp. cmx-4-68]|uniref:GntR family transcriptional regulator n=1 Tax=Amycolatopsis sp. cmx-4-68 TaxID=2790938 RepID=UPI00397B17E4
MLVYSQLRSAILNGELAPGERLKAAGLSARFEVSLSVVREALGLLAAKNLVLVDRNRGFRVTPLSLQALTDLTEARAINEGSALRLCGRWLITSLDPIYERDVLAPVLPGTPVPLASIEGFRPSDRFLAHVLGRRGYQVPDNLCGDDRPGEVADFYDSLFTWLPGKASCPRPP